MGARIRVIPQGARTQPTATSRIYQKWRLDAGGYVALGNYNADRMPPNPLISGRICRVGAGASGAWLSQYLFGGSGRG